MNTIKIYLSESLSVADLRKDFPLYQGQFQSKLLNVFVPKTLLSVDYDIQHYIGRMTSVGLPSTDTLNAFVITHTPTSRQPQESDFIDVIATIDENIVLYRYTFTTEWTYEQVESFAIDQMAGTSVKLGMVATAPNGQVVKSKSYYMRYLKDITYQNVEYALYERKLPKEFTAFSGVGENAPKMVINVVNVSTNGLATINDIVCSQTCSFEVLPSSILDRDESIQPSELETLTTLVNELISAYNGKQDKNSNDLNTTSKAIVGAINELKGQQDTNTSNISTAQGDISDLETAVAYIQEHFATPETYIGQMTGDSLPSDQDLTDFVESEMGRSPRNADVIIFVLEVEGGTDKNYKYTYSYSGWNGYEIPPMEKASNGTAGLVEGTYNVGDTNNTLVDIVGGKIKEVYVNIKEEGTAVYMTLSQVIPAIVSWINGVENGTQQVGYAKKADKDGNGNEIATTYMTNTIGATKSFVKDYALPRTFNDIFYYTGNTASGNYSKTNDSSLKHRDVTLQLGYTSLLTAVMTTDSVFQLSSKNSFENTFYLKDSSLVASTEEHTLYVRVETSVSQDNGTTYTPINVEVSDLITFVNTTDLVKVQVGGTFDLLGETVLNIQEGDLIKQQFSAYTESTNGINGVSIYWGSNYPLKFNLNTQQVVFSSGLLGEQPTFANASSSDEQVTIDGQSASAKIYYLPDSPQLNDGVEGMFVLTGNLQDVVNIGIRVGDSETYEEFALKVPSTYFNNDMYVTMSDIEGLPIRKNNASNDQIVFKGFIRNTESEKYILIDVGGGASGGIDFQEAKKELVIGFTGAYNSTTDAMEFTIDNTDLIPYLDVEDENIILKLFINNQTMTYTMLTKPIRFVNMNTGFLQTGYGRLYDIAYLTNMSQATPLTLLDLKKYAITDWEYILNVSVKDTVGNKDLFVTNERSDIEVLKGSDMPTYLTNAPHGQVVLCTERYESGGHNYQKGNLYQVDRTTYSTPTYINISSGLQEVSLSGNSGLLTDNDFDSLVNYRAYIVKGSDFYFFGRYSGSYMYYYQYMEATEDISSISYIKIDTTYKTWHEYFQSHTIYGTSIKSYGATQGQVLTANGSGGASWQNASGGTTLTEQTNANYRPTLALILAIVKNSKGRIKGNINWLLSSGATLIGNPNNIIYAEQSYFMYNEAFAYLVETTHHIVTMTLYINDNGSIGSQNVEDLDTSTGTVTSKTVTYSATYSKVRYWNDTQITQL